MLYVYIIKKTHYSLTILGDQELLVWVKIRLLLGSFSRSPAMHINYKQMFLVYSSSPAPGGAVVNEEVTG